LTVVCLKWRRGSGTSNDCLSKLCRTLQIPAEVSSPLVPLLARRIALSPWPPWIPKNHPGVKPKLTVNLPPSHLNHTLHL
jgi:hypothetical protein